MSRILAIALFAACSHNEPKPATPAPESTAQAQPGDPAPCEAVTAAILKRRSETIPAGKVKDVILKHCQDDHWSAEARRCVVTANTEAEATACAAKFSHAQSQAYSEDMAALGITVEQQPPAAQPQ